MVARVAARPQHIKEIGSPVVVNPLNRSRYSCEYIKKFRMFSSQLLSHRECIQQNALSTFHTRVKPMWMIKW